MSDIDLSQSLNEAVAALRAGRAIIMIDDEDRENEGDIVIAAEHVTPEAINFMVTHARGLVCLSLESRQVEQLQLPMMVHHNTARLRTAFTVSIEARHGVTTGTSAHDRARTIQIASAPDAKPEDVVSPGHVFPLRAAPGGVLARAGHTEGSLEIMQLAGLRPAAVICEVMSADGSMARLPELREFGLRHGLPIVTIAELVEHRLHLNASSDASSIAKPEKSIEEIGASRLPSAFIKSDDVIVHAFRDPQTGLDHLAIVKGEPGGQVRPLVRVHSECLTGDALGSLRCDCGPQLQAALRHISESVVGVVIYVRGHEGRGIGLANKIRAYALQDQGLDTVDANHELGFATDERDWETAARILRHLGVTSVDLMTNNLDKVASLAVHGIKVVQRVPLVVQANPHNLAYLEAKRSRMGHILPHMASS